MIDTKSLDDIIKKANYSKENKIIGILIAPYEDDIVKKLILENLDNFDKISKQYINFYCAGYTINKYQKELKVVSKVGGNKWYFKKEYFDNIINELSEKTTWKYDEVPVLLLLKIKSSINNCNRLEDMIDFDKSLIFNLNEMIKHKSKDIIKNLFLEIFKNSKEQKSIEELSDNLLMKDGMLTLLRIIESTCKLRLTELYKIWYEKRPFFIQSIKKR